MILVWITIILSLKVLFLLRKSLQKSNFPGKKAFLLEYSEMILVNKWNTE